MAHVIMAQDKSSFRVSMRGDCWPYKEKPLLLELQKDGVK